MLDTCFMFTGYICGLCQDVVKHVNPYPVKFFYLNFHPLKVVSRCRDPQPQVGENYAYLFNLDEAFVNFDV